MPAINNINNFENQTAYENLRRSPRLAKWDWVTMISGAAILTLSGVGLVYGCKGISNSPKNLRRKRVTKMTARRRRFHKIHVRHLNQKREWCRPSKLSKKKRTLESGAILTHYKTLGDGSCAFHALLGKPTTKGYKCDVKKARSDFSNYLREKFEKFEASEGIKNILRDLYYNSSKAPRQMRKLISQKKAVYGEDEIGFIYDREIYGAYLKDLERTKRWLDQVELIEAAVCFNKKLALCQPGWGKDKDKVGMVTKNLGGKDEVVVWYDGKSHYERAKIREGLKK